MQTSLKWIKALVPGLACTPQEYTDAMILSGSKVEFYTQQDADLDKIVIGQITEITPHPDADKLVVCQVNVGTETLQIVTGAPNVEVGQKVPVVLDGGKVAGGHDGSKTPGGIKIKAGKLRGEPSAGMMGSIEELGSDRNMFPEAPEEGIYIFPEDAKIGSDAVKALGLDDVVVEYEITSNRVDCFSVLGIAREAAATFDLNFEPPVVPETGNDEDVNDIVTVEIANPELCSRYTARMVKNVKFAPSPEWMQERLRSHGIRPINNLVDITNYVMEEYGQPMHAFDLDTVAQNKIVVRTAENGEKFVTLDGQERTLDDQTLMICDGEKAIGIAGIMGGENSMITEDVHTVLFESACFNGTNIRKSAKKLGMRTDASSKFEKGLDPNLAIEAINRACALVEELGCGEVVGGVVDVYPNPVGDRTLPFEPDRYNHLLGTDIPAEDMLRWLDKLEIPYNKETNELTIPSWRQDLLSYADIAEEVARFFGYANIPMSLPKGEATMGGLSFKQRVEALVRDAAEHCGYSGSMFYSFESPKVFDKLMMDENDPLRQTVVISNPLGEDFSIMRTTPLNGMLTALSTNMNRRNKNVHLYEMGNIYLPKALPLTELPDEQMMLTLGFYGEGDFFTMKGTVEEILGELGIRGKLRCEPGKRPYLHPGRQAEMNCNGKHIGYLGEVHPKVLANYSMKDRAYVAVLEMPKLVEMADFDRKYTGIARFPAATRDISMVVPTSVLAGQIEDVFEKKGGAYLESYQLFDIYEGAQILAGFKSMAYSLVFRAPDKNLSEEDITTAMNRILKALDALGIQLRA